jgi:hypothetical protein
MLQRPAIKNFLMVQMAHLAALQKWTPGGTSWLLMPSLIAGALLSNYCSLDCGPIAVRRVWMTL